jgi:hypothetical protein
MNELGFVIDMKKKEVFALGGVEPILDTQSGHLVVTIIGRRVPELNRESQRVHKKAKTHVSHESEFQLNRRSNFERKSKWSQIHKKDMPKSLYAYDCYCSEPEEESEELDAHPFENQSVSQQDTDTANPLQKKSDPDKVHRETNLSKAMTTSPVTQTVSSCHSEETWTKAQRVAKTKILSLKSGDIIRFRANESEEWYRALVTNRAGKVSGRYANTFNVQMDGSDETQVVELTNKSVEKLTVSQNVKKIDTG